jgi:two-component system sensor histidine kinase VicK
VSVSLRDEGGQLAIDVTDTGIGIRPEECARIFERFYRAEDARVSKITGTGLGLSLAREVARLHGGDVSVQSEIDKGSTFTLTLPPSAKAA